MPLAGRVGDQAKNGADEGPGKQGSPDVFINGHAALRVGDPGKGWQAKKGSRGVLINGIPVHRVGDETSHHTGDGQLVEGSPDVFVGDRGGGEAKPVPHDKTLEVKVSDALERPIEEVTVRVSCPHKDDVDHKITGTTTLSGLCSSSTVMVQKSLQKGTWDPGASSGEIVAPTHAHVTPPAPAQARVVAPAQAAAPAAKVAAPAPAAAAPAPAAAAPAPATGGAAAPATHVVHAPAPPATPPAQQEVHIVRPTTASAQVTLTTVHNWAELIFRAFNQTMPTAATEIAILGVREASLSGKGTVDQLETAAGEGKTDKVTFTTEARDANFAHATTWNDLLFIAYTDSTPAKAQHVEVFECTIDAGSVESSLGTPVTLEGKLYSGQPGSHISSRYPGSDVALHLFSDTAGKMALARECTKSARTFSAIASAKNAATNWRFASVEDNSSIHMHFGAEAGNVGTWSTGCTVLHHHLFIKTKSGARVQDAAATRYKRFMELYRGAANKKKIPYLVVSSEYIRGYAEWARLVGEKPEEGSKPASVIMKDKLRSATGMDGRYLASFIKTSFANEVNALAADKATSAAHAANLRSSMQLVTFTLSI
jgi:uncharacterized Zn-binding protein involved in type VI secretion